MSTTALAPSEGKTKIVRPDEDGNSCVIENKNDITALDNPELTRQFGTKAVSATTTTCNVFAMLRDANVPVAFDKQLSETTFQAPYCRMIPLECIYRREVAGSYKKRRPDLADGTRFHRGVTEFFLKTSKGVLQDIHGNTHQLNLTSAWDTKEQKDIIDDPFIRNPYETGILQLRHPKMPDWLESNLDAVVQMSQVLPAGITIENLEEQVRRCFLVLERAWGILGLRLIDFKIEFGIGKDGKLYIADVIDADSWRLRTRDNKELSKQPFRDGSPLSDVEQIYTRVARLSEQLRIPRQAIVLWTGSPNDKYPDVPEVGGVAIEKICCSAHKAPAKTMIELEQVLAKYPDGGVIVALVGMSNGLGPILSARTSWPVIGVPLTYESCPSDIFSNLNLPSNVPMMTVINPKNAVLAALNILGESNPAAYAARQYEIEKLDI